MDETTRIPRDEFSTQRRSVINNPGAVGTSTRLDIDDFYGNLETWAIDTFRVDGRTTVFIQRLGVTSDLNMRLVLPPAITAVLERQGGQLLGKVRRVGARKALETRRLRGDRIGNPAALEAARRARKARKK